MAMYYNVPTSIYVKGLQNNWRWEWLDKQVGENRVSDVFRKLVEKGCAFYVPCQKK